MERALAFLDGLAPPLVYAVLGVGAALENLIPPIPADTFVVLGGVMAGRGEADARLVFLTTWLANVGTALLVYGVGLRYGETFFRNGRGRFLLSSGQLARMQRFYDRFGVAAILFTRFLPGLRSVVPVFAGVTRQSWPRVAIPVGLASAVWYGGLVWLGTATGRRLDEMARWLDDANRTLLVVAVVLIAALLGWWWRTRTTDDAAE